MNRSIPAERTVIAKSPRRQHAEVLEKSCLEQKVSGAKTASKYGGHEAEGGPMELFRLRNGILGERGPPSKSLKNE